MTAVWLFFYVMTWQQYSLKWRGKMWQPSGGGQRAETNKAWPLPYQLKQTWPLLYQLKQTKHNPCCINWNKTWPLLYQLKQNMTPAVPTEKNKNLPLLYQLKQNMTLVCQLKQNWPCCAKPSQCDYACPKLCCGTVTQKRTEVLGTLWHWQQLLMHLVKMYSKVLNTALKRNATSADLQPTKPTCTDGPTNTTRTAPTETNKQDTTPVAPIDSLQN